MLRIIIKLFKKIIKNIHLSKSNISETDDFWSQYYDQISSSPNAWISWSKRLREVSEFLWRCFEPSLIKLPKQNITVRDFYAIEQMPIVMMLSGLSIELVAKARYIKKNRPDINKKILYSHKIINLIKNSILTKQEIELIKRLEIFVQWAGRYPIPKKKNNLIPKEVRRRGGVFPTWSPVDKATIDGLYLKLFKATNEDCN